jgi:hypothetical protein
VGRGRSCLCNDALRDLRPCCVFFQWTLGPSRVLLRPAGVSQRRVEGNSVTSLSPPGWKPESLELGPHGPSQLVSSPPHPVPPGSGAFSGAGDLWLASQLPGPEEALQ